MNICLREIMAAGAEFSTTFTIIEGSYNKENASKIKDDECLDDLKQTSNAKPPRHISVVRHSMGSITLTPAVEMV